MKFLFRTVLAVSLIAFFVFAYLGRWVPAISFLAAGYGLFFIYLYLKRLAVKKIPGRHRRGLGNRIRD